MVFSKNIFFKVLSASLFVAMIYVNYLANALPIAGNTTGGISDSYQNLFAPAGITFAIWGLIYLLLFAYSVYQFAYGKKTPKKEELIFNINKYFILTSVANIAWIFAWHNKVIFLSLLLMLVILYGLIKIADILNKNKLKGNDKLFIDIPFSVYFGWITVATIANFTVFFVSVGWNGFGLPDTFWAVSILLVGMGIGIWRALKDRNLAYIIVLVWAYLGIYIKHTSVTGFDGRYPLVSWTAIFAIVAFLATSFSLFRKPK